MPLAAVVLGTALTTVVVEVPVASADADVSTTPPPAAANADGERDPLWPVPPPTRADGATVARIVSPIRGRRRLASPRSAVALAPTTDWSRQAQTLLVLDSAERRGTRWVKLLLPSRPNGSTAWVHRDALLLSRTRYWIDVSTRARTVTVYRNGHRLRRFRAVVGARRTPTPRTLAAVYERNRQPDPKAFLGPWALSLTALSNVLDDYGGGPGRVAIHGRSGTSLADPLGSARSHGCVRIDNHQVSFLARRLVPGTPVLLH